MNEPTLAIPPGITEIMRGVKTFAPAVGRVAVPLGSVVAIAPLLEYAEQEMKERILRGLKKRTKRGEEDNTRVVKVSAAIDCVENITRDPALLLRTAKEVVKVFTGEPRTIINVLTDEIAQCIREKALPQTSRRGRVTYRYSKREI